MRGPPRTRSTGDARVDALLGWYGEGLFPMGDAETGAVSLYTAHPRGVLDITDPRVPRVSRSLARAMRNRGFVYTTDTRFDEVIAMCAQPRADDPEQEGAWITDELVGWYQAAHGAGYAHSLEVTLGDPATGERVLVGGIYGVSIGAAFFGESMSCLPRPRLPDGSRDPLDGTDASKAALVTLCAHLRASGFMLFDTQMVTPHVATLGGTEIAKDAYMRRLEEAIAEQDRWAALPA
ncbi:MAG: leucyl/phenylalanyl-tRNA--protein transferase [Planctomycetota bacterium]